MVDASLYSKVEVCLSAADLAKGDTFSKSDPACVVSLYNQRTAQWQELLRTETIQNNHQPEWHTRLVVDFTFEVEQKLKFDVYDMDGTSPDLTKHTFLGQCTMLLGKLMASRGQRASLSLLRRDGTPAKGTLTLRAEELSEQKDTVNFDVAGAGLDKMDFFGKSDPFLQFFRMREDTSLVEVHTTEHLTKTLSPQWRPFALTAQALCNNDHKRPLVIKCQDWNKKGTPSLIGQFQTSLAELLKSPKTTFTLTRPADKDPKKRATAHGTITFNKVELVREVRPASFLDYIKGGGMQVGLMVAIDFTGSNGHPDDPSSLHYRKGATPNQYQQAITTIGSIVAQYDSDGRFPVYGFGGKLASGTTSHCFPLAEAEARVQGVQGVLDAYNGTFRHVLLSGPTCFAEIIQQAGTIASQPYTPQLQHYTILLILTDGIINDMEETIGAIVGASDRPLSIIIMGVGDANFADMVRLDGDKQPLESKGQRSKRDIVQFVAFKTAARGHVSQLAAETLAEVPAQVLGFMKMHQIKPLLPLAQQGDTKAPQPAQPQPSAQQPLMVPAGAAVMSYPLAGAVYPSLPATFVAVAQQPAVMVMAPPPTMVLAAAPPQPLSGALLAVAVAPPAYTE